jgi:DNA-binding NtrC family response regulator
MANDSAVDRLVRRGHFAEVLSVIGGRADLALDLQTTRAEALSIVGHGEEAQSLAEHLVSLRDLSCRDAARCVGVVARELWDVGRMEESIAASRDALKRALEAGDNEQICLASGRLLERTCDRTWFDASLPLALQTRKYATRCGDRQVAAATHLTFGRLEGKVAHFDLAIRHVNQARGLLVDDPNARLSAESFLEEACILGLIGDLIRAAEVAERGLDASLESGWATGSVVARNNLAHLYTAMGRFEDARLQLDLVQQSKHRPLTLAFALHDTRTQFALAVGDYASAASELNQYAQPQANIARWCHFATQETSARLAMREGRFGDVVNLADAAIQVARECGAASYVKTFSLYRMEALAGLGSTLDRNDICVSAALEDYPLNVTSLSDLAIAKTLSACGQRTRAYGYAARARRLLAFTGSRLAEADAASAQETLQDAVVSDGSVAPDLDTAAALIELGAHPHILAREAFTAIRDAGCAEAVAVVVAGKEGPRVIDTYGWTERQAAAAAGKDDVIVMPAGTHRDETWQIVALARTGVDDHCTLAALGRVVAAAVALENYRRAEKQRAALWPAEALEGDGEAIWASEQSAELLAIARRIAPTGLSVLLTGETGTGKEMLARAIHRASDRATRPFLPFNCAAVPRDMIESQLFGYRRGAFTGADSAFAGVIRSAAGGTLFLDEIAEIGIDLQPKLLRFLETHEIHPIGEPQPVTVDVRVIAATNGKIEDLVAAGRFREDLFYRLNVIRLKLPPLRERREEIPSLVQHYLRRYAEEQKKGGLALSDETLEYLLLYSWPGNVRQLANEVRRMAALAEPDATLTPALLSPEIQASRRTIAVADAVDVEARVRLDQPLPIAVEMLEQMMVRRALDRSRGRVEEASRLLGISRKGLFLKRRRWGLPRAS